MTIFRTILDLATGRTLPDQEVVPARRWQVIFAAALGAIALGGLWGLAAGSSSIALALSNVYKVPMVVLFSMTCAIPAGLLAWKLCATTAPKHESLDILQAFVVGVFTATLVLAVLSPLLALYYHSSVWAGPMIGLGSTGTAIIVGMIVFIRATMNRIAAKNRKKELLFPVGVFVFMLLATCVQFVALASPILPEKTVFDRGIDAMVKQ